MKKDKVMQYILTTTWIISLLAMFCVVSAYCDDEISDMQAIYLGMLTSGICVASFILTVKGEKEWQ